MLLDMLTDEEKALLAGICTVSEYGVGATVVCEGDPGNSMLLIRKGRVEVREQLNAGNYKRLRELGPGDVFGEMSLFTRTSRSASVVTLNPCEILEMTGGDLDRLAEEHPVIGAKIYRGLGKELAERLSRTDEELRKAVLRALEGLDQG